MMQTTLAGPSVETIISWQKQRESAQGPILAEMRQIQRVVNGDLVIPMPEMDKVEEPAVANNIAVGIDQYAGRMSSTMPNIYYPPVREQMQGSKELARGRMRATWSWMQTNQMQLKHRRRYRYLVGYGDTPLVIVWDKKQQMPKWQLRNPLSSFPAPTDDPDEIAPPNHIFKYQRRLSWLIDTFPAEIMALNVGSTNPRMDSEWDIVEYLDDEVKVLIVVGHESTGMAGSGRGQKYVELMRIPNLIGMSPTVSPGRITLDRRAGQFNSAVGMYKAQARILALEMISVEKGIFPNIYLVSRPNEQAKFISGPWDGRTGKVNVIAGGDIHTEQQQFSMGAGNLADRLERNGRITTGTVAEMGGESQSNVRTGKRGDSIMSAAIDVPIQEAQELIAASMEREIKIAIAMDKAYSGSKRKSFIISAKFGTKATPGTVTYVPNQTFENDNVRVTYPMAGADVNGLIIGIGQRRGLGMMSAETAMELDPYVADPTEEKKKVQVESLEQALMASIQQQAQAGSIPAHDLAAIGVLIRDDQDLFSAVQKAQAAAQKRQASMAPEPGEGEAAAPETQSGMAQPGAGAEMQPPPSAQAPSQGLSNITDVLRTLRNGQRESPSERGVPQ